MIYEKVRSMSRMELFDNYLDAAKKGSNSIFEFPKEEIQIITNSMKGEATAKTAIGIYEGLVNVLSARGKCTANTKILDYGCGWGRITSLLAHCISDSNIYGVDIDKSLINSAKKCLPTFNFETIKSMKKTPFEDNFFDVVFANSVFSHLSAKSALFTLSELCRITSQNGLIILSVLEKNNLDSFYIHEEQRAWIKKILGDKKRAEAVLLKKGFVWKCSRWWGHYGIAIMSDSWLCRALSSNRAQLKETYRINNTNSHSYKVIEKI